MPRPKRTRQAPTANDPKPSEPATTSTVDEDNQRGRTRGRTRALRSTKVQNGPSEEDALRDARSRRDAALDGLSDEEPTVTSGADDTRNSVEVGRRILATPSARRDTTGLDLADDSVFGDLGDSFAEGNVPEAPPSGASSSATMSRFKTRPRSRQSSIIGRNDAPIRPSSRGGNTPGVSSSFNIGLFRRRAREPSILATSRRALSQTGSVASSRAASVARDPSSESEGESAPGEEATPSRRRRRQSVGRSQQLESPQPSPEPRRRSARKRKSDDVAQSESARPTKTSRVEANGGLLIDSDSELSDLPSPSPPEARFSRPVTPLKKDDNITAPPASSDSEADIPWPDIHTLAKKRRRPSVTAATATATATTPLRQTADHLSDASTPPSLTHSPNQAATRGRAAAAKRQLPPTIITTADLTNLLPKRTYNKRHREEFNIDSDEDDDEASSSGEEKDQPSHTRTRTRTLSQRRSKTSRPPSRASTQNTILKPKQGLPEGRSPVRLTRAANKTYRSAEDKENESGDDELDNSQFQPLPDDTFDDGAESSDVQNADELKRASLKFREVDEWELSFEEVAEPPSPEGAR